MIGYQQASGVERGDQERSAAYRPGDLLEEGDRCLGSRLLEVPEELPRAIAGPEAVGAGEAVDPIHLDSQAAETAKDPQCAVGFRTEDHDRSGYIQGGRCCPRLASQSRNRYVRRLPPLCGRHDSAGADERVVTSARLGTSPGVFERHGILVERATDLQRLAAWAEDWDRLATLVPQRRPRLSHAWIASLLPPRPGQRGGGFTRLRPGADRRPLVLPLRLQGERASRSDAPGCRSTQGALRRRAPCGRPPSRPARDLRGPGLGTRPGRGPGPGSSRFRRRADLPATDVARAGSGL